ncbi:MAG: Ribonuclease P protein component [Candidatus Wolfebacteria bacterium GW2011_GWE1_48_7]|uniref:Ribonuclease P protein component, ribonuclease P protein component n=1 Tax=Candidatus Wolfebacteria bacterium GW2011_GWB1_47_1 TaxID=1619007 RepID=A0A0G4AQG6_9BACT|nr:MAG: ribonuclease P protein component, ribonuclease P protein component [Candidatus Wolfebacteria bacterium GW2011_GWB1_47_1]KKU36810.1 MAG: Ribonuclease P protein component [Candidatus Wolfebacteria bacterium GW2011_GWC2_46_275]KKU42000.1 MAG: Ribonuclease P protein component [Candidatus Wolfebacteria bacterium GW2011_GWB2_46_69]KKU54464.1 MAG: Ribonuclease P protein component [Candidatus Wolfebacteria bacterium GW2011_GWC1_47_103]KKU59791.1 MAG: Ribonuclease P protein component [Candidatus
MLAKKFKLNIAEFIKKRPTFVKKGPFFAVKYVPNGLSYSRFGVVVGKKVDKRATERNKIKRMFYEGIRGRNLQNSEGQDVMILIYPETKQFTKGDIKQIIKEFEFAK